MKLRITLNNSGGELDAKVIDADPGVYEDCSDAIKSAMDDWTLAPGDSIEISEIE